MDEQNNPRKKKSGRTLLIDANDKTELSYDTIESIHQTSNGSRFVVFNTAEDGEKAYNELTENGVRVKYSYYKIFFRLRDMDLHDASYDILKAEIMAKLLSLGEKINVLYFKFYTKNNQLIGSGDLTLDSKDSLDAVVEQREIELSNGKVSLYRYRLRSRNNFEQRSAPANI